MADKLDLAALRKLAAAATPAPWQIDTGRYEDMDGDDDVSFARGPMVHRPVQGDWITQSMRDATFISAARDAVPALIAEVERLRAENVELAADVAGHRERATTYERERDEARAEVEALREVIRIENSCASCGADLLPRGARGCYDCPLDDEKIEDWEEAHQAALRLARLEPFGTR